MGVLYGIRLYDKVLGSKIQKSIERKMMTINNEEVFFKDVEHVSKELWGESERASVIVGSALLDETLRQIITNFLIQDKTSKKKHDKELFEGYGPLATFSARIKIAFRLGLISENEKRNLDLIRKMRNDFAHKIDDLSFDDKTIRGYVRTLNLTKTTDNIQDAWARFQVYVFVLKHRLDTRALEAEQERRQEKIS